MDGAIGLPRTIMNNSAKLKWLWVCGRVNNFFIQFFGGQHVDKCLLQFVNPASDKALSALPII